MRWKLRIAVSPSLCSDQLKRKEADVSKSSSSSASDVTMMEVTEESNATSPPPDIAVKNAEELQAADPCASTTGKG